MHKSPQNILPKQRYTTNKYLLKCSIELGGGNEEKEGKGGFSS